MPSRKMSEFLRDSEDLSSSVRSQMMTSQTFTYILTSILKRTIHLVFSQFISKNEGGKVSAAMDLLPSLQEDIFPQNKGRNLKR